MRGSVQVGAWCDRQDRKTLKLSFSCGVCWDFVLEVMDMRCVVKSNENLRGRHQDVVQIPPPPPKPHRVGPLHREASCGGRALGPLRFDRQCHRELPLVLGR